MYVTGGRCNENSDIESVWREIETSRTTKRTGKGGTGELLQDGLGIVVQTILENLRKG